MTSSPEHISDAAARIDAAYGDRTDDPLNAQEVVTVLDAINDEAEEITDSRDAKLAAVAEIADKVAVLPDTRALRRELILAQIAKNHRRRSQLSGRIITRY